MTFTTGGTKKSQAQKTREVVGAVGGFFAGFIPVKQTQPNRAKTQARLEHLPGYAAPVAQFLYPSTTKEAGIDAALTVATVGVGKLIRPAAKGGKALLGKLIPSKPPKVTRLGDDLLGAGKRLDDVPARPPTPKPAGRAGGLVGGTLAVGAIGGGAYLLGRAGGPWNLFGGGGGGGNGGTDPNGPHGPEAGGGPYPPGFDPYAGAYGAEFIDPGYGAASGGAGFFEPGGLFIGEGGLPTVPGLAIAAGVGLGVAALASKRRKK